MKFISEPIEPLELGNTAMAAGEPAIPQRFCWRKVNYAVAEVVSKEREFQPEGHTAGNEKYLRKHWYDILTTSGERMRIYCERQARGRDRRQRWWLYSISSDEM